MNPVYLAAPKLSWMLLTSNQMLLHHVHLCSKLKSWDSTLHISQKQKFYTIEFQVLTFWHWCFPSLAKIILMISEVWHVFHFLPSPNLFWWYQGHVIFFISSHCQKYFGDIWGAKEIPTCTFGELWLDGNYDDVKDTSMFVLFFHCHHNIVSMVWTVIHCRHNPWTVIHCHHCHSLSSLWNIYIYIVIINDAYWWIMMIMIYQLLTNIHIHYIMTYKS